MINKDLRKSLARKNGNEIIIWGWNNPLAIEGVAVACFCSPSCLVCLHLNHQLLHIFYAGQ